MANRTNARTLRRTRAIAFHQLSPIRITSPLRHGTIIKRDDLGGLQAPTLTSPCATSPMADTPADPHEASHSPTMDTFNSATVSTGAYILPNSRAAHRAISRKAKEVDLREVYEKQDQQYFLAIPDGPPIITASEFELNYTDPLEGIDPFDAYTENSASSDTASPESVGRGFDE